jgi:aryl-alcohol dehydrogenase-like predicted oxidoreductase
MLPIPGTSSPQHVEENIAAASLKLPDPMYKQLEAVTPPPASLR